MHPIVFITTKKTIHKTRFLAISCDEVIMIDNQCWVFIHAYLMQSFKHILVLLLLERSISGGTSNNLTIVIFNSLLVYGDFIVQ
jgi:hypothetical protein